MHYLKYIGKVEFIFKSKLSVVKNISGFTAIAQKNATLLILGSMPSETSLKKQQYYGHERNAFWPIILSILTNKSTHQIPNYKQRKQLLIKNNIAVWDVLQSCFRQGSLDTAIKMDSIKTNDFYQFFSTHTAIKKVCFNGAKAETIYRKYVFPTMNEQFSYLHYCRLPSTSPAHATMTLHQKTAIWEKQIKDYNKATRAE
ncbi:MAG: DNA-deoxyinosine glycosylase [Methylococcaceae bacterium]